MPRSPRRSGSFGVIRRDNVFLVSGVLAQLTYVAFEIVLPVSLGFALAPFLGLQVRDGFGDSAMWGMFAAISAVAGVVACRGTRSRARPEDVGGEPAAA